MFLNNQQQKHTDFEILKTDELWKSFELGEWMIHITFNFVSNALENLVYLYFGMCPPPCLYNLGNAFTCIYFYLETILLGQTKVFE